MSEVVRDAMAGLSAAYDALAGCDVGALTGEELVSLMDDLETLGCRLPSQWQRMLARLQGETSPRELGAKSWHEVLRVRWRLAGGEASRRLGEAAELEPRRSVTGEPLDAVLPAVAAARARGALTAEHVRVLRETMGEVPSWVDPVTRSQLEVDLVRVAVGVGPKELRETAALRLFLLDQDGPLPDDAERARKRGVATGRQGRDGMTPLTGQLDPEAAAVWEVLMARFAAPGMCNPADPEPCTSGTPTQAQIDDDYRSLAQRQHDAVKVIGRIALMTDLGRLNGLPVSIIIRTTLADLESRVGVAVSGGGTKLSMRDLDRLGGHAAYHLCVFDGATGSALNHYRGKRVATPAQRIMLIAKYGGCTKPGCTVGPYGCQIHHAVADFADGGNTNVDEMAPACGADNRMVTEGGWRTRITEGGECAWDPPKHLDHGQARYNTYHRPELLLRPFDDEPAAAMEPAPAPPPPLRGGDEPAFAADLKPVASPLWEDDEMPFRPLDENTGDEAAAAGDQDSPAESAPPGPPERNLPFHDGPLPTSTTTRNRSRDELRSLLTNCAPKPHGHNITHQPGGPEPPN